MKLSSFVRYLSCILLFWLSISSTFALGIDHFNVTLEPENIKSGEAADLTIEAVDKNDNTVTDYVGSILVFSETDEEADFPTVLKDSSYSFNISDEWKVTFENAVVFKNTGVQSISIYDLDDDTVWWEASLEVMKKEVINNTDIQILSPEDRVTLWWNEIIVSGQTKKNHWVQVVIDNQEEQETTSNSDGIFEVTLSELSDGEHSIKAHVYNADKDIIGTSEPIVVNIDASLPVFKGFDIKPGKTDLAPTQEMELIVLATKWLTKVQVILNDTIEDLAEVSDGLYTKVVYAPEEPGNYKVDIFLQDELSHDLKIPWADTIEVNELQVAPVVVISEAEPETIPEQQPQDPLQIQNLKLTELKTKSILSWDKVSTAENYNIYKVVTDESGKPTGQLELIDTVVESQIEIPIIGDEIRYDYFAVRAQAKTGSWEELYEWDLSEAAKIKTGPEIYILLLISILVGGFMFFMKNRA